MVFVAPRLAQELTDAWWQRSKGLVTKAGSPPTGVGQLLKEVEAKYKAIDWKKLDIDVPAEVTSEKFAEIYGPVDKELAGFPGLITALEKAELQAKGTAIKWRKDSLMPSSSTRITDSVAAAASRLADGLKRMLQLYTQKKDAVSRSIKVVDKPGEDDANIFRRHARLVERKTKRMDEKDWRELWQHNVRPCAKAMLMLQDEFPQLDAERVKWKRFFPQMPEPNDEREFKKMIAFLVKSIDEGLAQLDGLKL